MRTLILGLLFISSLAVSSVSHAQKVCSSGRFQAEGGDYWPWGKEIDFPWNGIQGLWVAYDKSGCSSYFSFRVLTQNQERLLKVEQYEMGTCKLLGRGLGYERDRIIKARFTGVKGDFDLRIHVFKESDVLKTSGKGRPLPSSKLVTVMAMSPANNPAQAGTLQIYKVNSDPAINCL